MDAPDDSWLKWIVGVVITVFGFIAKRFYDRVEQCVTRDELEKVVLDMRQERRDMHLENRDTLDRIHERVDQLWDRHQQRR